MLFRSDDSQLWKLNSNIRAQQPQLIPGSPQQIANEVRTQQMHPNGEAIGPSNVLGDCILWARVTCSTKRYIKFSRYTKDHSLTSKTNMNETEEKLKLLDIRRHPNIVQDHCSFRFKVFFEEILEKIFDVVEYIQSNRETSTNGDYNNNL